MTLLGGHGTAGAWGSVLERDHGIQGAMTLGMACATFGLIIGGLVGGPLAKWLIRRHQLQGPQVTPADAITWWKPTRTTLSRPAKHGSITTDATIETLALFAGCLAFAQLMTAAHRRCQLSAAYLCLGAGRWGGDSQHAGLCVPLQSV